MSGLKSVANPYIRFAAKHHNCCLWEVTPAKLAEYHQAMRDERVRRMNEDADTIMADTNAADQLGII